MNKLSVLVVIVNWNHGKYLQDCFDALITQSYSEYQILVVDNDSSDGSQEWIRQEYPDVCLWISPENIGFSKALNQAIRSTQEQFVLSLNPDVNIRSDFISELINAALQDERIGIVAPKLLRADDPSRLDSTGLFIDRRRRPFDRGQGEFDRGQFDLNIEVFGACGAAALYRRTMLEDIAINDEYFDEDFFAYYEDADLCWRAQLKGWRTIYVPTAVAVHIRGWGDTFRKKREKNSLGPRLALRNRYLMTVKNDSFTSFLADFPIILATELPRLVYIAFFLPYALLGIIDIIRLMPSALHKRRLIQKTRQISINVIRQKFFMASSN